VLVLSRNGNDISLSCPEVAELAGLLDGHRVILDGEIVALEPGDRPSFARLQERIHQAHPTQALLDRIAVMYFGSTRSTSVVTT